MPHTAERLTPAFITARDIPDAWFQCIENVLELGRQVIVDHGSYEGQKRWELDFVTVRITHPFIHPLIPTIPNHLSEIPPPAVMSAEEEQQTGILSVESYLPYLMTNQPPKPNETYTYGERITNQMEKIIHRYKKYGYGSNQECISVSRPEDIELTDPPCLRMIDTRIFANKNTPFIGHLHFYVYFRSWDLWGGFPLNLAAIVTMQEYMAESIGVLPGELIVMSKGLHLYDHGWDIAKLIVDYKKG